MKILISPAKTLDYDSKVPFKEAFEPQFTDQIAQIHQVMQKKSAKQLGELMDISENLSQLNYERFQNFEKEFTDKNSRQAIYAFAGDVYTGIDAYTLSKKDINRAQESLRILSGLYGLLKPLDFIQPYRLEMGTKVQIGKAADLYAFWKKQITQTLNDELATDELVVNLASKEYFKAVNTKDLKGKLISPVFKDYKNDKLKVISFFAKKARGSMARYLIENNAKTMKTLLAFQEDSYRYSAEHTINESEPVFIR